MIKSIFKKLEDVLEEWYNIATDYSSIVQLYSNKDRICIKNTHKW